MDSLELAISDALENEVEREHCISLLKRVKGAVDKLKALDDKEVQDAEVICDELFVILANNLLALHSKLNKKKVEAKQLRGSLSETQAVCEGHQKASEALVSHLEQMAKQAEDIQKAREASEVNLLRMCLQQGPKGVLKWCRECLKQQGKSIPPGLDTLVAEAPGSTPASMDQEEDRHAKLLDDNLEIILLAWQPLLQQLEQRSPEDYRPISNAQETTDFANVRKKGEEGERGSFAERANEQIRQHRDRSHRVSRSSSEIEEQPLEACRPGHGHQEQDRLHLHQTSASPPDHECTTAQQSALVDFLMLTQRQLEVLGLPKFIDQGIATAVEELTYSILMVESMLWLPALFLALPFAVTRFYVKTGQQLFGVATNVAVKLASCIVPSGWIPKSWLC